MSAILQFSLVVVFVGFSLMGLAFGIGHLIAWHKNRIFVRELEKINSAED